MSTGQKVVMWAAILVAIGMYLLPPVAYPHTYGRNKPRGYQPVWAVEDNLVIDYGRLLVQYGIVAAIALVAVKTSRRV